MRRPVDLGQTVDPLAFERGADQRLPLHYAELIEGMALSAGRGLQLTELSRPTESGTRTSAADLSRAIAMDELRPFPVPREPALEAGNHAIGARAAQLAGKHGATDRAEQTRIEILDGHAVQSPRHKRQRQQGRELENEATTGKRHEQGRSYGAGRPVQGGAAPGVLLAISSRFPSMLARLLAVGYVPALVLLAQPSALMPRSDPHPQLSGLWTLNPLLSKGAGQRFNRASTGRRGREEPPEEGGFGGAFPERLGGGNRSLGELLRPKEQLTIAQTDTLITVTDDAGWSRELIPTGQRMREELGQGGPAEIVTRWRGDKLTTERFLDAGGTYSETYELNRKTGRLTLQMSFKAGRMPRAIESTRVYERENQ